MALKTVPPPEQEEAPYAPGGPEPFLFEDFTGGLNTNASRPGIEDNEESWCDGFFPIGPGDARTLWGVGAAIYSAIVIPPEEPVPQLHGYQVTASGNFTTPAGTTTATVYKITLTGPGGDGYQDTGVPVYYGGGAGASVVVWASGFAAGNNIAVVIGAAGGSASTIVALTMNAASGSAASVGGPGLGGAATGPAGALLFGGGDGLSSSLASSGLGGASLWGGAGEQANYGTGSPAAGSAGPGYALFEWIQ